jgi:hypothetical protein
MTPRRWIFLALLLASAFAQGCAGVIEFNTPEPYKDKKLVQDPPDTLLIRPGAKLC